MSDRLHSPAEFAEEVTPSDTSDLTAPCRAVYVGGAGNLKVTTVGGDTVTFSGLPVGWHPIRASRIFATGTTATNIMAVR